MYYGDEIGMGDNIYLGDRDGVRTPMQWTGDRNAGFSKADPAALYLPFLMDPVYGYQACSVEAQERVSTSLLQWVRRMLQVRKQHPVFGIGDYEPLYPDNRRVLAFYRQLGADVVLVVANLSRFAQPVELDLSRFHGLVPEEMFGRTPFPVIDDEPYRLGLGPHGFYWFHLVEPPSETEDTAMFRAIRTRPCSWFAYARPERRSPPRIPVRSVRLFNQRRARSCLPASRRRGRLRLNVASRRMKLTQVAASWSGPTGHRRRSCPEPGGLPAALVHPRPSRSSCAGTPPWPRPTCSGRGPGSGRAADPVRTPPGPAGRPARRRRRLMLDFPATAGRAGRPAAGAARGPWRARRRRAGPRGPGPLRLPGRAGGRGGRCARRCATASLGGCWTAVMAAR